MDADEGESRARPRDVAEIEVLARARGLDPTGRVETWRRRRAQDQPAIDAVRHRCLDLESPSEDGPGPRPEVGSTPDPGPAARPQGSASVVDRVKVALRTIADQASTRAFTAVLTGRARSDALATEARASRGEVPETCTGSSSR